MRKSRFTEVQIVAILQEAEAGLPLADLLRKHGISRPTFYSWRSRYGGATVAELTWHAWSCGRGAASLAGGWNRAGPTFRFLRTRDCIARLAAEAAARRTNPLKREWDSPRLQPLG